MKVLFIDRCQVVKDAHMRTYDLILKKRSGQALSEAEINELVEGYVKDSVPDYQMAAFTMAVFFQGLNDDETLALTRAIVNSGETIDLEHLPGVKVDKHSTGGVGDTTTLVLVPLVAAAGVTVAKLSGRGLGHTGGTLDKLESIPGFRTGLSNDAFSEAVKEIGAAVAAQGQNLVPADQKLYALRDVTATVDSIPLISASIMAKKLAIGADALVLDVKTGAGAFMKDTEKAFELARAMAGIGRGAGRETVAVISRMDQPLGKAAGNALEVQEAILTLRGKGPADLEELCLKLGGWMVYLGGKADCPERGQDILKELIENGAALAKFKELISKQGGDLRVVDDFSLLPGAERQIELKSKDEGHIRALDAFKIGSAAVSLGAGRGKKDDPIDPAVGITLEKKIGDKVEVGQVIAVIQARSETSRFLIDSVGKMIRSAYQYSAGSVTAPPLICGWIDQKGDEHHV